MVLLCNWVKANYNGSSATIKRDKYGFTLVNFTSFILILDQSFALLINMEQVFFSKDPKERNWKVILWKDPHGRCIIEKV
jgi:hypothetical protein